MEIANWKKLSKSRKNGNPTRILSIGGNRDPKIATGVIEKINFAKGLTMISKCGKMNLS